MSTSPKQGEVWVSSDHMRFRVIEVVKVDDHMWVYYRNEKTGQEYSCYQESFEQRFSPVPV